MRRSGEGFAGATKKTDRRSFLRAAGIGGLTAAVLPPRGRIAEAQDTPAGPADADSRMGAPGGISVFPGHGTMTALPSTEVSFRGVSIELLGPVRAAGSKSGGHSGTLSEHADGRGVSFLPDAAFEPGESVTVSAGVAVRQSAEGSVVFTIARPATKVAPAAHREVNKPAGPTQVFRSRHDLRPPVIEATMEAVDTAPGNIFVAPRIPDGQSGAMILDQNGELVWYAPPAVDLSECNDFRVQEYRGQPVLTWWEGAAPVGYGFGHFVICNSSCERIAELQVGNGLPGGDVHEFLLTPQGTALVAIYNPVLWHRSSIGGLDNVTVLDGIIQEIEIETGRVLFEWHSLDHIDLEETYVGPPRRIGGPLDYVHINSIEVDTDGNLIISGRHTHAIYKIDRVTGEIIWRLHGKRSDFRMGPNARFAWQHDARRQLNGTLTLFDNHESGTGVGGNSRGMVLDLDMGAMTATLTYQYIHPTAILSVSQGNMQVLPNGNLFVGWGSAPVFSEFGPEGDLRFNGRLPGGVMSYRAYRAPWSGHPTSLPNIAVDAVTGDRAVIYASWNGATKVSRWRVLSGSSPNRMRALGPATVPRTGFETRIETRLGEQYVAVQALDGLGNVLGTSEVATVK